MRCGAVRSGHVTPGDSWDDVLSYSAAPLPCVSSVFFNFPNWSGAGRSAERGGEGRGKEWEEKKDDSATPKEK